MLTGHAPVQPPKKRGRHRRWLRLQTMWLQMCLQMCMQLRLQPGRILMQATALTLLASVTAPHAQTAVLQKSALMAFYQNLTALDAEFAQQRYSPYLSKPVTSRVRLHWQGDQLVYHVLSPIDTKLTYDGKVFTQVTRPSGAAPGSPPQTGEPLPAPVARHIQGVMRFVKNLINANLEALETDFALSFLADTMVAEPKAGSALAFLGKLTIKFSEDLKLQSLTIENGPDKSVLTVTALHYRQRTKRP